MSAFPLLVERQLLKSRGVRWSATLSLQQCVLTFHTGETPLYEVNSKQNDSFVLSLDYMQKSKTVIIKKCSTPAKFLFYYLNGIPITSSSSIIEQPFFHIEEKCSSNQRRPKTKKARISACYQYGKSWFLCPYGIVRDFWAVKMKKVLENQGLFLAEKERFDHCCI